jgi:hypothetical protein
MALSSAARVLAWGGRRKGFPDMLGECGCALVGTRRLRYFRRALVVWERHRRMCAVRLVGGPWNLLQ